MRHRSIVFALFALTLAVGLEVSANAQPRIFHMDRQRTHGWLGVNIEDVTHRLAEEKDLTATSGAYVQDVTEDSPAEDAGIKEGDVIVKLDGKTIEDTGDLTRALSHMKPNTEVKVEVVRKNEHKEFSVKLEKAPESYAYSYSYSTPPTPRIPSTPFHFNFSFNNDFDGLGVQELTRQLADYFEVPDRRGLLVTSVKKGSSAEEAGFKAGDVVVKVDGNKIEDVGDLRDAVRHEEKEHSVDCSVIRKGKSVSLKWRISEEEDEDGLSSDESELYAPHMKRQMLDHLKQELNSLHMKLRRGLQQLKQSLHNDFFSS